MANTVIKLKKSSVPSVSPTDLEYGEIAINYADGRLYYKDSTDTIKHISAGNNYSTVNVGGTFLTSAIENAILSIAAGDNIELTPDFLNDAFTITANLKVAFDVANAAFAVANSVSGGIDLYALSNTVNAAFAVANIGHTTANSGYDKANSAWDLAYYTGVGSNAYSDFIGLSSFNYANSVVINANTYTNVSVEAANNYAGSMSNTVLTIAQAAFDRANLSNDILFIESAYNTANAAYDTANLALPALTTGNLTFSSTIPLVGPNLSNTAGERIIFWPQRPSGAYYNYSFGLEHDAIWFGVDTGLATTGFKWYAGNTKIMELARNANLTVSYINTDNIKFGDGTVQNTAARYDLINLAFDVANAAFGSANNVAPQVEPAFNTANAAYLNSNTAFDVANAAFGSANNVAPQVKPAFDTANAAFDKANNALANTSGVVFNGTLTISQDIIINGNVAHVNTVNFHTDGGTSNSTPGVIGWNGTDNTLNLGLGNNSVLQIGQETLYYVINQSGEPIYNGNVCMFAGTTGASGHLKVARSDGTYPSQYVMGVATQDIPNGGQGFVTHFGKVNDVDTSMFSAGDILYLDPAHNGAMTNTAPKAPNQKTIVASVVNKHAVNGTLFVRTTLGSSLGNDELVELGALANGDVLTYGAANGRFENSGVLVSTYNTTNAAFGHSNTTYAAVNSAFGVINAAFGIANNAYTSTNGTAAFAFANGVATNATAAFGHSNTTYAAVNSAFGVINAAFTQSNTDNVRLSAAYVVVNSAFGSVNTVGGYANTAGSLANQAGVIANAGFGHSNTTYGAVNSAFGVINAAFGSVNTVGGYANTAGSLANQAGVIANAAYDRANTKTYTFYQATAPATSNAHDIWVNSDTGVAYENFGTTSSPVWAEFGPTGVDAGGPGVGSFTDITATGNVTVGKEIFVTYTPAAAVNAAVHISAANTKGGIGYADVLKLTNLSGGVTNPNKWIRINDTGNLEIVNSAYNMVSAYFTDSGNLTIAGSITTGAWTPGQVIKDVMLDNSQLSVLATTVATSTSDTDFISYSYTPVSTSSYLVIHMHVASYDAGTGSGTGTDSYISRIKVDGTEITWSKQYTRDNYTFRSGVLFPLTGRYTNSSTTAKAITVAVRRDSADDSITITNSSTSLWMRITEIAR